MYKSDAVNPIWYNCVALNPNWLILFFENPAFIKSVAVIVLFCTSAAVKFKGNSLIALICDESDDDELEGLKIEPPTKKAKTQGGSRKKRRGNGHKANCKCPICKNMKKGTKTRRKRR